MAQWYDAPNYYKESNNCGCPTKYWKAFLMDYVTLPLYNRFFNAIISAPLILGNIITFGNFFGGSICIHDAVVIYFRCVKCGSTFPCTFDLVDTGSRHRFGYFEATLLAKYHQTKLWLARDDMKSVFEQFNVGPEKYDPLFYNCSHYANQFYDAIRKLDKQSKSYKWTRVLGIGIPPICCSESDCFVYEKTCFCSSEKWKAYQMDLNTVMIFDELKMKRFRVTYTTDIDVVTLHFKCSECQKEFKTAFYYYEKICRKNGYFRRSLFTKKSIHLELSHDSLKPFLDRNQCYTSQKYAENLFYFLDGTSAAGRFVQSVKSLLF